MSIPHLVLSLVLIALGTFMVVKRKSLPFRRADQKAAAIPPTGYGILGAMLIVNGLLQFAQAFN